MITYIKGNMFDSPARILVNTVNTVGVMGKGIALEFKNRYPDMFCEYKKLCDNNSLKIGTLFLWKKSEKWVLLFPTKVNWRNPSKLSYIEKGLQKFADNWDKMGANSIAFPKLGCGNGALEWDEVRPLMEYYLGKLPLQIYIYVDNYHVPQPEHQNIKEMEQWLMTQGEMDGFAGFLCELKHKLKLDGCSVSDNEDSKDVVMIEGKLMETASLYRLWSYVRDVGVVLEENFPSDIRQNAGSVMKIMRSLNYVSPILVSKDGENFPDTPNAYQYIGS